MMAGKTSKTAGAGKLHLKWIRSAICAPIKHKLVIKGLGFTRLNQVIERPDTPAIRGMVEEGAASGGNRPVVKFQGFKVFRDESVKR